MRMPRSSIRGLLGVVIIIGLDLGAGRALAVYDDEAALCVWPINVALQLTLRQAMRGSARRRPFCLGFVMLGSLCPFTFLMASCIPELTARIPWVVPAIVRYLEWSINGLSHRLDPALRPHNDVVWVLAPAFAVLALLPQLLVARAGGILGYAVVGPTVRHLRSRCRGAVPFESLG